MARAPTKAPPSPWQRWLPTLIGAGVALGTVAAYESGLVGPGSADDSEEQRAQAAMADTPDGSDGSPTGWTAPSPGARSHPGRAREAETVESRVAALEAQNEVLAERSVTGELGYFGHSESELEAMARHCDVRSDYPTRLSEEQLEDLGMAPDEEEAYTAALTAFAESDNALYRSIYAELYPDAEVDVETLAMRDVRKGIMRAVGGTGKDAHIALRRALAEERAGLAEPPDDASLDPFQRYTRARFGGGDRFAARLETELGPERVDELRRAYEGWPGARTREWGCEGDEAQASPR